MQTKNLINKRGANSKFSVSGMTIVHKTVLFNVMNILKSRRCFFVSLCTNTPTGLSTVQDFT